MPMIIELLKLYKFMLMARSIVMISEEMTRNFYASYVAIDKNALPKNANSLVQPPTTR